MQDALTGTALPTDVDPDLEDYTAVADTLTFGPGSFSTDTRTTTGLLSIVDDRRVEGPETIDLGFVNLTPNGMSITIATAPDDAHQVTINDNDVATLSFASATSSVLENNTDHLVTATLTLTCTGSGPIGLDVPVTVDVNYNGAGTATAGASQMPGVDFSYTDTSLTFMPFNGTSATQDVTVTIFDDLNVEVPPNPGETIVLNLESLSSPAVLGTSAHTITIIEDDSAASAQFDATVPGAYTLRINGGNIEIYQGMTLVASAPLAGSAQFVFNGTPGADTLTLDFSGGDFTVPITFNGGAGGDEIVLTDSSMMRTFTTVTHTFVDEATGSIMVTGSALISYTGLEPVTDNLDATNRVFTFTGGTETITLTNTGGADNMQTIDSTLGESVAFVSPTATLTINAGTGADTITLTSVDVAFPAAVVWAIDGGIASDILQGALIHDVTLTNLDGSGADGNVATDFVGTFTDIEQLVGDGAGTLTGASTGGTTGTWDLDGGATENYTLVPGGSLPFAGFATLTGGSNADTFNVQGPGAVSLNLNGGGGADVFNINLLLTGSIDGGADSDILNITTFPNSNVTIGALAANGATLTLPVTVVNGAVTGIDVLNADATGQLTGENAVDRVWGLDGTPTYTNVAATLILNFTGFATLQGGTGADTVNVTTVLSNYTVNTGAGADTISFTDAGSLSGAINGEGDTDSLIGDANGNSFAITALNTGTLATKTTGWSNFENLTGGVGNDTIAFQAGGSIEGTITAGAGTNELNYSALATAITVNLTNGLASHVFANAPAGVSGIQIVRGGSNNDTITGDGNNNTLIGNGENDVLADGGGNDSLDGGDNDDTYLMTPGSADVITDSSGNDTANFVGSAAGIALDMDSAAVQTVNGANTVQLVGQIENFIGSNLNDTVSVNALLGVARDMQGGLLAGDVLNIDASGLTVTDTGTSFTFSGGFGTISYSGWETINLTGAAAIVITGTGGNESVVLTATNANSGSYAVNGGSAISFGGVASYTFNGMAGDDTMTINNPAGSLFAPVGGVVYAAGNNAGDNLILNSGTAVTVEHQFTNNNDGFILYNGVTAITYTGLAPIADNISATNRIFTFSGGADTITLVDDGTVGNGLQTIDSNLAESVTFLRPTTSLTINAGSGGDTINLSRVDSLFSANFTVNGDAATDAVNVLDVLNVGAGTVIINSESIAFDNITNGSLTTTGNVTLNASLTNITSNGVGTDVTANGLTIDAVTGINIDTSVATINGSVSGTGNLVIDEANAVALTDVDTADGDVTITAGGNLTVTDVVAAGADGDVSLTASAGNVTVSTITATDDVSVTATAGSILDDAAATLISGDALTLSAATGIGTGAGTSLDTSVASVTATSTAGNINLAEADGVTLTSILAGNGAITVTAGGAMIATSVVVTVDADANDITLTTTSGGITGGIINSGVTAGDVTLNAQGAINVVGLIAADNLLADAVGAITANTTINTANLSTSTIGNIAIVETNAITLTDVDTANGAISVTAGGAMIATDVQSLTNADANDITLITTGANTNSIAINTVNAGAAGDVTLTSAGAINDDGSTVTVITGDVLTAMAAGAITVDTTVVTAAVTATAPGNIDIDETNGITLTNITTANGSITVDAAGSIVATAVTSTTDSDANDIAITATAGGTITAGDIDAGVSSGDVTLTAAGAIFDDGDATTDIAGDLAAITCVGAIGSAVNDLDLDVNSLTTNSNGSAQFLNEDDTLVVGAADLNAGASTIRLGGGTFQTTATGSILCSTLNVGDGAGATATLAGDGNVTGLVAVASDGIVAPGASTGILNAQNGVSFVNNAIFSVEVNGSTPGTLHDQLNVTGLVTLGGATLTTSGTISSSPGQVIVLINNDGVDAVSGTFETAANVVIADGDTVTINGVIFLISYAGGAGGNDVTLTEAGGTVTFTDNDGAADTWEVRRVGANIQVLNGATIVDSRPFAAGTAINIVGEDGQHDTLLVNFTGGDSVPVGDISFTGGSGGGMDRVRLLGNGVSTTANYTPSSTVANAGLVTFDSGNVLGFSGLEPLDIHAMAAVTLTGSSGVDALTVNLSTDFTLGGANAALRVSGTVNGGTTIETMAVWNSSSLTINGAAGNDTLALNSITTGVGINIVVIDAGGDNDAININGLLTAPTSIQINGNLGDDTVTFANAGQLVSLLPVDGGGGNDTLIGDSNGNEFTVTGANSGTLVGKGTAVPNFISFENLTGGTGSDTFTFADAGSLTGAVNGGSGTDTIVGDNDGNIFTVTALNTGTLAGKTSGFSSVENLTGGTVTDTFTINAGAALSGGISDLGGLDSLTKLGDNNAWNITGLNSGTLTSGLGTGFSGIDSLIGGIGDDSFTVGTIGSLTGSINGGGGTNSLTQTDGNNAWLINSLNAGTVNDIGGGFTNIQNVTGGSGSDTFTFTNAGSLDGAVAGGSGTDTLIGDDDGNAFALTSTNAGTLATKTSGFSSIENLTGGTGVDTFLIGSGATLSGSINGAAGTNSLTQADGTNSWNITGANSGTVTDVGGAFSNIQNLNGGTGADTFTFTDVGSLSGSVNGDMGNDTIIGDNDGNLFTINLLNGGSLAVKIGGTFSNVENLTGGNAGDTFTFLTTGSLDGDVNGGDGSDTIVGDNDGNEFIVTGNDEGTLTDKLDDFTNVENLTGGTGVDLFTINAGANLSEAVRGMAGTDTLNIDGDGTVGSYDGGTEIDTLDLADVEPVQVDLQNTSATGITGNFSNVENFIGNNDGSLGNTNNATLIGRDAVTTWTIGGVNDGSLSVPALTTFFNFNNLQGGAAADTFNVSGIGDITGSINGGEGTDLFDIDTGITGSLDGEGDADTLTGTEIDDVTLTGSDGGSGFGFTGNEADVAGGFAGIDSIAGAAAGTLTGEDVDSTWTLDGNSLGDRFYDDGNDVLEFSGFSTVQGGSAIDTFDVTNATTLELRGGDGVDIFNLEAVLTGDIFAEGGLDLINFLLGGSVSGNVDGGSSAELNYSAVAGPISVVVQGQGTIDGYQGTATSIVGIFNNITTLVGSSGTDTLTGGDSESTWELGSTATYQGFNSNQTLQFSDIETLQGGSFADTFNVNEDYSANLNGGEEDDTFNLNGTLTGIVNGQLGTDTLQGSLVDDVTLSGVGTLDGFQGDEPDLTHFNNINAVFGNGGTLTGLSEPSIWRLDGTPTYEAGGRVLEIGGFANLQGGDSTDDFLVTADSTFNLLGGLGEDTFDINATLTGSIAGQDGEDTLEGDEIDDVTLFGSDSDGFIGGELNITGNFSGINTITGNGGRILGAPVASTWELNGSPTYSDGTNLLNFSGFDTLQGNSAVDRFIVSADSPFSLRGGAGNDTFTFSGGRLTNGGTADGEIGNDTLDGTDATDSLTLAGGAGNDTIIGSSFGDDLRGGDGNDSVRGVDGNDTLSGGSGINTLDGGAGTDCVTDLTADNATLTNTSYVGIGRNTLISIECAEIFGDASNNLIDASAFTLGGVTLHGGAGNDTLIGTGLNDSLDGGAGLDTVRLKFTKNPIDAPFITAPNNTTLKDNTSTDMLLSIEALDLTGHATRPTRIDAGAFNGFTTLVGGVGNDTLIAGQKDSLLKGGAGHDNMTGGAGWDLFYGAAGNDTMSGGIGNDIMRGEDGNDSVQGGLGDDRLFGDAGRDVLKGGDGQDSIDGGADNDTILGGAGHDSVTGGAGNDLISGGAGHDTMFGGAGNDSILGDEGDDSISGDAGTDLLLGGDGNDKINGGSDKDTIAGNAGDDTLVGAQSNEINEFFIFDFHKLLI